VQSCRAIVAASAFGPRLQAAIATLSVRNRVSRRDLVELCEELFGARICAGTVDAILARTGQALKAPYEELLDRVRCAPALNVDETGWRLRGAQRTLWGAFTQRVASSASPQTVTSSAWASCSASTRGS